MNFEMKIFVKFSQFPTVFETNKHRRRALNFQKYENEDENFHLNFRLKRFVLGPRWRI